ncbi:hypothetical protein [Enterococcus faecium]|uniref:hypothetical protein n=1 Tax=Enterococcus faecium TaxID=1352 RepID=UPI00226E94E5|nr:hypothetical protein [Enterococcus faecium]
MKTAVSQVYSILNSNEKTKNIDFYTNSVPESAQTVPSLPVGRITEISGNYEDFASNNPLTIQFNVQVDVWVSTMKEVDAFYFALDEVMRGMVGNAHTRNKQMTRIWKVQSGLSNDM